MKKIQFWNLSVVAANCFEGASSFFSSDCYEWKDEKREEMREKDNETIILHTFNITVLHH